MYADWLNAYENALTRHDLKHCVNIYCVNIVSYWGAFKNVITWRLRLRRFVLLSASMKCITASLSLEILSTPFRSFNRLTYTSKFHVHYCETARQLKHSSDNSILHPPVVNVVLLWLRCWMPRTNDVTVDRLTSLLSTCCQCECNPLNGTGK